MSAERKEFSETNYGQKFADLEYASPELLNPKNHTLVLIDHEGQMFSAVEGVNRVELRNNLEMLSFFTRVYQIPVILSTIGEKLFAGPLFREIRQIYHDVPTYDRWTMNAWEDKATREAIIKTGKKKLVMAGLWTDICLGFTVISALKAGYEVYFIADASGATSKEAHEMAVQRMIQVGAIPLAAITYVAEILRDYSRADNASPEIGSLAHEGMIRYMNFGVGVDYADFMVPSYPPYKGFER
jgi:hypothetical protein